MLMHAEVSGDFVERSTSVPSHPRLKTPTKEIITLLSCSFSEAMVIMPCKDGLGDHPQE
jgi:hypothetical protein